MRKPLSVGVRVEAPVRDPFDAKLERIAAPLRALDEPAVRSTFLVPDDATLLKTTLSLCPECLAHVPAAVFEHGGRVLLHKRCALHGASAGVLENDTRFYHLSNKDRWGKRYADGRVMDIPAFDAGPGACCAPGETCAPPPSATPWHHDFSDQRTNKTCTVLVEVTDACNLACRVCYADSKGDRILPLETFRTYMQALVAQKGTLDSVQVTGGEASLHPQFWEILDVLHAEPGVAKIYLPTNGIELSKPGQAARLKNYRDKLLVLLQFDGYAEATNRALRQAQPVHVRDRLLRQLERLGIPMQLTMTLARGISEAEIAAVVRAGLKHRNVRLVAMQPATYSGRYDLAPDPLQRMTLSDVVKGVVAALPKKTQQNDFLPIPCSHPNCGWVTLYARRFGLLANIARHVDLVAVMNRVAYKTMLTEREMQDIVGTKREAWWRRVLAQLGRRLIRPRDVFGIAIKPFMDRYSYDQDRVSSCCHHLLDTDGNLTSFCEYNARLRPGDSWAKFPPLERHTRARPEPAGPQTA